MNCFARALKEAGRHWGRLGLAFACSLLAAALWSVNIGAIFPIIEATVQGESLQGWNQNRIARAEKEIQRLQIQLASLETQAGVQPNEASPPVAADLLRGQLRAEQYAQASYARLQPYLERLLPSKPFQTVLLIVLLVLVSTILKQGLSMADTMLVASVSQSISRNIRQRIFDKALVLDRGGFNQIGTSGFATYISQITDTLAVGVANFYGGALNEPLRVIACLTGAMLISWRLTLLSLIFAPFSALSIVWLNRQVRNISRRFLDRSLGYHQVMIEVFGSLQTVQAFTMEDYERERFRAATGELRRSSMRAAYYNSLAGPLTEICGIAMVCTALAAASYLIIYQQTSIFGITIASRPLTVSSIMVFFGLMLGAADPLRKLSGVVTCINSGMAAANMLYPLLDVQPQIVDPPEPKPMAAPHRLLEFRNVHFTYDGVCWVLRDINLTIPFGERLAVLGPNGGGKSTLINLMCRFFDPQVGEVTMDGISLKDVSLKEHRGRVALVTQQTELFDQTILHNIRYGSWTATDDAVIQAAKRARAHDFISGFADGYHTRVGPNGQRLSGGQRQRIALARAILRDAEILILDEATSQIDVDSETLIHDALIDYGQGRTMIIVSHRPSVLALATRVVQLEDGQFKELAWTPAKAA